MNGGLDLLLPLPHAEASAAVVATEVEMRDLALRLGIPAVLALACRYRVHPRHGGRFEAEGTLTARVTLECRVSLDAFDSDLHEPFSVVFVLPETLPAGDEAELDAVDELPYGPAGLPLGEATAEQLALALPPYPRKPGAEMPGTASDDGANPFAALSKLRH